MDELNKRIVEVMLRYNHSKSSLASELGVSLPLITHITSGRNKPGIDFLQKVLSHFKEINPYWLFLGEGEMMKPKPKSLNVSPILEKLANLEQFVHEVETTQQTTLAYHKLLFDEIMHLKEINSQIAQSSQNLAFLKQQLEELKKTVNQLQN